jgi:hypothetical protein
MRKNIYWEIAFVGAAVALGLVLSIKPWRLFLEQRAQINRDAANTQKAQASASELARKKARLNSGVGKEETARSHGYQKPGEIPVDALPPDKKAGSRKTGENSSISLQGEG